jgi:hypothetical protein
MIPVTNKTTQSVARPQRYSVRRPKYDMRNQDMIVPKDAMPKPPIDILNEILVGRPACMKKYVGVPP